MDEQGSHQGEVSPNEVWTGAPCPHCGSRDIVSGMRMNVQGIEVGPFGLKYRAFAGLMGTEAILADLCRACGTVMRLWVKNTDRKWDIK